MLLVENAHGVAVADAAAAYLHEQRIAVGDHVHIEHRLVRQAEQHDRGSPARRRRYRAWSGAGSAVRGRGRHAISALKIAVAVVSDQLPRPANLVHDLVAGVDAKRASDAFELRAVADVDARGADGHALSAVDAIAAAFPALPFLWGPRGSPSEAAIGDEQRIGVEHGALNARPGAHIDADLLAGEPAQKIGRRR